MWKALSMFSAALAVIVLLVCAERGSGRSAMLLVLLLLGASVYCDWRAHQAQERVSK